MFKCDLDTCGEFSEEEEEAGVTIYLNEDDDNASGTEDRNDTEVKADAAKPWTQDEDDLNMLKMEVNPDVSQLTEGKLVLGRSSPKIRVWSAVTKGTGNEVLVTEMEKEFDLSTQAGKDAFLALKDDLWVEGYDLTGEDGAGNDLLVQLYLEYNYPDGRKCAKDTINIKVKNMPIVIKKPATIKQFECAEFEIILSDDFFHNESELASTDRYFDAYDADCDGNMIKVDAVFTVEGDSYEVPCFAMKPTKDGDFEWKVRFTPPNGGTWEVAAKAWVRHTSKAAKGDEDAERTETICGEVITFYEHKHGYGATHCENFPEAKIKFVAQPGTVKTGPLRLAKPAEPGQPAENKYYLYHEVLAGQQYSPKLFFGVGWGRPWVVNVPPDERSGNAWENWGSEYIDRQTEVYDQMKPDGATHHLNFFAHWMAPWDTMLVHRAQEEKWEITRGFERKSLTGDARWHPFMYFDQGRADSMDKILQNCEAKESYVLLTIWGHKALAQDNYWCAGNWKPLPGGEPRWKCNGLSAFKKQEADPDGIDVDDFFQSSPDAAEGSWQKRLWDHQANYYRYLIARWGYSRALGLWETVSEVEGVGTGQNHVGGTGKFFTAPFTPWHNHLVTFLKNNDPFGHLVTVSTTWYAGDPSKRDQYYVGGSGLAKVDVADHHTYPIVRGDGSINVDASKSNFQTDAFAMLTLIAKRIHDWNVGATNDPEAGNLPRIVGEFAIAERLANESWDEYGAKLPSYTHFGIWAGFASGGATTPLKWCDGKKFGEMRFRNDGDDPPGHWFYSEENYPPNSFDELKALDKFVNENDPVVFTGLELHPGLAVSPDWEVYGMRSADESYVIVWIYNKHGTGHVSGAELGLTELVPDTPFEVRWFNTWTGEPLTDWEDITDNDGKTYANGDLFTEIHDLGHSAAPDQDPIKYDKNDIACKIRAK